MRTYQQALMALIIAAFAFTCVATAQVNTKMAKANSDLTVAESENLFVIGEKEYRCFRELDCLKRNRELIDKGLNIKFNGSNASDLYILQGESRNEKIYAEYNSRGLLMHGYLIRTNVMLPAEIRNTLNEIGYSDWRVIGNEVEIVNFDRKSTEYKVVLQKDDEVRVVQFDRNGVPKRSI